MERFSVEKAADDLAVAVREERHENGCAGPPPSQNNASASCRHLARAVGFERQPTRALAEPAETVEAKIIVRHGGTRCREYPSAGSGGRLTEHDAREVSRRDS